jgi:hypothetical protein
VEEKDVIWLAGFFDGDGSYNTGVIVISQKNLHILRVVRDITGLGRIRKLTNQYGTEYYRLEMKDDEANQVYSIVRPYMRSWKATEMDALYSYVTL